MEFKKGKPKIHLFADEPCHLEVYGHSLGSSRRVCRVGFELEKDLSKLLLATRRRRTLRIWDQKGLVLKAERLDASRMRFQYSVRFSIPKFEGKPDNPKSPQVWARNGKMVIKGRGVRKSGLVSGEMEYAEMERALAAKAAKGSAC
jgi:hypothetical protein